MELVDLRYIGIFHFTANGLVANNVGYELDAIILSTGYTVPVKRASPSSRAKKSRSPAATGPPWRPIGRRASQPSMGWVMTCD
ncbi:uncharacterized protein BDW70DRAFT_139935 [Aspergillus foveolatus]|uniref:uncharacterized protein n=1 Tax=Aspergillus foveolatus TaxID=210207 RepID=UPI003CCD43A7